jgi:uncharacterized membrane protein
MEQWIDPGMALLILAAAVATYLTRIGGYVLITRMKTMPPRVQAALDAVPAAVLTTLWAPAFFINGWDVKLALIFAGLVSLRFPPLVMLVAGWAVALALRRIGGL